jgi:hypothetical protein
MKKIFIFIFLATFFSISLALPKKILALNCSGGISGQFLDENGKPFKGVGWIVTTNGIQDPSSNAKDHMFSGVSDSQGKFNISPDAYNSLNGTMVLSWLRANYLSEKLTLDKCTGLTISLKPLGQNTNPRCGYICKNDAYCDEGSDNCKLCVEVEPGIKRCTDPSWGGGTYNLCQGNQECTNCLGGGNSWTALGCLKTSNSQDFVAWILKFAIGIGGGIAFLLIIWGGFQIILSAGNPEKVKAGKEIITAAIAGLLLIIFSVFILRLIGYDIIGIPGFTQIQTGGGGPVHLVK